jgi:hypothetical protein
VNGRLTREGTDGDREERIRPRFNRFAMFRVQHDSFHEIERVVWEPEWPNCRIALSGWIQGLPSQHIERKARIYVQSSSFQERRDEIQAVLQGSLALHRLLEKQKSYCGHDASSTAGRISEFEQDYSAHQESPTGTSFLRRAPGPSGCIIVINEDGDTVYFGTAEKYGR